MSTFRGQSPMRLSESNDAMWYLFGFLHAHLLSETIYLTIRNVIPLQWLQITCVSIVYSTVCSGADQRKYQSFTSLSFTRGIHRWPMNSPHQQRGKCLDLMTASCTNGLLNARHTYIFVKKNIRYNSSIGESSETYVFAYDFVSISESNWNKEFVSLTSGTRVFYFL